MTTIVSELYDALRKAGVDEDLARAAAKAVIAAEDKEQLATKADLDGLRLATKTDLAELRGELRREMADMRHSIILWNLATMITVAGVVLAIVRLG